VRGLFASRRCPVSSGLDDFAKPRPSEPAGGVTGTTRSQFIMIHKNQVTDTLKVNHCPLNASCKSLDMGISCLEGRFATGSFWQTRLRFRNKALGMYLCMGMKRTLVILLLTLRMLASPLAMRPESPRTPANYRLVTRICAWPAPAPQRCLSATSLVPYFGGRFPESAEGRKYSYDPPNHRSLTRATLSRLASPALRGRCSGQLTDCLRC
jgi:hypothetical protein